MILGLGRGLLAALALLSAAPAQAFVRAQVPGGGPCLFWARRELDFSLNIDGTADVPGDAELTAARKSFKNWEDVACSDLRFVDRGLTSSRAAGHVDKTDDQNVILWRPNLCEDVVPQGEPCLAQGACANQWDCWDHSAGVIAVTTTISNPRTGQIVDADIELNDTSYLFTVTDNPALVRTDVENTLTHEIGHLFGLDHTAVAGATMQATAREGDVDKRTLAEDDVQGLCTIYPAGAPVVTCLGDVEIDAVETDDDNGCLCGAGGSGGLWMLPFLLLGRARRGLRRRFGSQEQRER